MTIKKPERRPWFQLLNNFEQVNAGWDWTILILLKSPLYFPIKNVWTCSDLNASYGRKNEQVDFFFWKINATLYTHHVMRKQKNNWLIAGY